MIKNFWVALIIALVLDAIDYVVGWIPILGDALDVFGIVVLYMMIGPIAILGAAELIPALDFLPIFTGTVVLSKIMRREN